MGRRARGEGFTGTSRRSRRSPAPPRVLLPLRVATADPRTRSELHALLEGWAALWGVPHLAQEIGLRVSTRLRRSLGTYRPSTRQITLAASGDYRPTREEQTMRQPGSLPPPDAPPPAGTISRADLAEVAIVSAVEPRARNRAFVVTQASEPRAGTDWRDALARMPSD